MRQSLDIALEHHRAGRLELAELVCRQILAVQPEQVEAWHLLGNRRRAIGEV